MRVAWIGLGVMGYPMAGHLVSRGGVDVTVYNRTPARPRNGLQTFKGGPPPRPPMRRRAPTSSFACVGNDDDLRQVTMGPEARFDTMKPGAVFVDHTTASADVARELHAEGQGEAWALSMRRCRAGRREPRTACSP